MPNFLYKAIDRQGQFSHGAVELATEREVLVYLENLNLIPLEITVNNRLFNLRLKGLISRRRSLPLLEITNGLWLLLRAGLPLDRALKSVHDAMQDESARSLLHDIEQQIREGRSLSSALDKHRQQLGDLYISMVRAGEVTGKLDEAVGKLAEHLEQSKQFRDSVVTAIVYPVILLVVTLISIIVLLVVVMPRFKQLFLDMGTEIPGLTQFFISLSDFVIDGGPYLLITGAMLLSGLLVLQRSDATNLWLDEHVLKVPWLGGLLRKAEMTRFAMALAMLMKNGVSIQKSIQISNGVISNRFIGNMIENKSRVISEGRTFSAALGDIFPGMTRQIIKMGEEASELENTLEHVAILSREDLNRTIKRMLVVFEPLVIVFLGVVVAAVIGSIMVAVLSMNDMVLM